MENDLDTHHATSPEAAARAYAAKGYWQPETLGQALHRWADTHGERIALTDHRGSTSYAELDRRADRLAAGLHRLGIRAGDRVMVQLPNASTFVALHFALFRLGALPILALPAQRSGDLDALCTLARPVAYVCEDRFLGFDYLDLAHGLQRRHDSLRHVLVDGEAGPHIRLDSLEAGDGALPADLPVPAPRDIACLLLSGGTTGTPKLIPRTHADYAFNARASAALCGLNADSVYLAALPAAHNFTFACPGILGTLASGGRVVLARTPGGDETFPLIARERVTITALVPALVPLWLQQREWDDSDLSSLAVLQVGGARLMPDVAARVSPVLGCRLQQVFGMAEGLLCYTRLDDPDEVILNTQGRPLCEDDDVRLVDADGADVPDGAPGELLVRGPYTIRGYYNAEAHNRTAFTPDGFYRSGDIVRRRPDGNVVVEGRLKEQINRAGEKIACAEVEAHLAAHPEVEAAVLLGLPDETLGERACAVLIARDGARPSLAALHEFLRGRGVPRFKQPDELRFVETWPLTAIGKVDRKRLAAVTAPQEGTATPVATPAPPPARRFLEARHLIDAEPLVLAALLAEHFASEPVTVYEREGEWSLGIGSVAEVQATPRHVVLRQDASARQWPAPDLMAGVSAALAALPFDGWRAYGLAEFELARVFTGLPATEPDAPLLELAIPRLECRLRDGEATLRALDEAGLGQLREALRRASADAARSGTDPLAARRRAHRLEPSGFEQAGAAAYRRGTAAAVQEILDGRYQKVILSRPVPLEGPLDMAATYVAGRRANRPARSFLLSRPGFSAAGFSPETVIEVDAAGWVSTQPLAGTRALGEDETINAALAAELLADPKEIAEHAVSVKLAFEELESCCEAGSVRASEFMAICRRGSVQHLGSRVVGRLAPGQDGWAAFRTLFPAVTASGIPKREAIEAIGRHEDGPRGLYSGCVMTADQDGTLDAALVLRSVYQRDGRGWLRAGAGIVGLSTPERELEETSEKLRSVAHHLVAAAPPAKADRTMQLDTQG